MNRELASTECGQQRNLQIACTAECAFNPFAPGNYDQYLELEDALIQSAIQRLARESAHDRELLHALADMRNSDDGISTSDYALLTHRLCFRKNAANTTFLERWLNDSSCRLATDERVLITRMRQTRPVLLEIHRVIDEQQVEGVDLFAGDGAPILVRDRALAASAVRFDCYLGWAFALPWYYRLSGVLAHFPEVGDMEPLEVAQEVVRFLGGPTAGPEIGLWITENHRKFEQSLDAGIKAQRDALFATVDAMSLEIEYTLECSPEEFIQQIETESALLPEPANDRYAYAKEGGEAEDRRAAELRAWAWEAEQTAGARPFGAIARQLMGRVVLYPASCLLTAFGKSNGAALRSAFENLMGARVRFSAERAEDLSHRLQKAETPYDPSLVPPRFKEAQGHILMTTSVISSEEPVNLYDADLKAFLEDKIPALENQTPREAARNPKLRPVLIRLMKQRVRQVDTISLRSGTQQDINWALRELGLNEIVFDPPPLRAPIGEEMDDDDLGDIDSVEFPWPPPLPNEPLTEQQVKERLSKLVKDFSDPEQLIQELELSDMDLLSEIATVSSGLLNEEQFDFLLAFLALLRFAMAPPGTRIPSISGDTLLEKLKAAAFADDIKIALTSKHQPNLLHAVFTLVAADSESQADPRDGKQIVAIFLILQAFCDTLDESLRVIWGRP